MLGKFGEDRVFRIIYNSHTSKLLDEYLSAIKRDGYNAMGENLQNILSCDYNNYGMKTSEDFNSLDAISLLQAILRTKEPKFFAESDLNIHKNKFSAYDGRILGHVSSITEVMAYDTGARKPGVRNQSKIPLEIYENPHPVFLANISAPILRPGHDDYEKIVEEYRDDTIQINDAEYYKEIERILLPVLLEQNAICKDRGKKAVITMPGIGCGAFAESKLGVPAALAKALKQLLETHADKLQNIHAVVLDTYKKLQHSEEKCGNTALIVAPSALEYDNLQNKPQSLAPLANSAQRARFCNARCENLGIEPIKPENVMSVTVMAGDKYACAGNDIIGYTHSNGMFYGVRSTDEGQKGAATDLMGVHTGVQGYYHSKENRYYSENANGGWYRKHYEKNKFNLLPLNDRTRVYVNLSSKQVTGNTPSYKHYEHVERSSAKPTRGNLPNNGMPISVQDLTAEFENFVKFRNFRIVHDYYYDNNHNNNHNNPYYYLAFKISSPEDMNAAYKAGEVLNNFYQIRSARNSKNTKSVLTFDNNGNKPVFKGHQKDEACVVLSAADCKKIQNVISKNTLLERQLLVQRQKDKRVIASLGKRLKQSEERAKGLVIQNKGMHNHNQKLLNDNETLKSRNTQLQGNINSLSTTVQTKEKEIKTLEEEFKTLDLNHTSLLDENKHIAKELEEKDKALEVKDKQLRKAKKQNLNLKALQTVHPICTAGIALLGACCMPVIQGIIFVCVSVSAAIMLSYYIGKANEQDKELC